MMTLLERPVGTPGLIRRFGRQFWQGADPVERRYLRVGGVLMLSGLVHLGVFGWRGGPWEGPVSYRKAVTFGLAFGLTVLTVTWVQRFLQLPGRLARLLLGAFVGACVLEVVLVSLQAWRGVPSHFNRDTAFDSAVSSILAAGGFVIVATTAVWTWAAWRRPVAAPSSCRLAIRIGFLGFALALAVGVAMIARGVSMEQTGSAAAAYHHAGSLKPAHADTMHAILVMPVLGWLLGQGDWTESMRGRLVAVAGAGYGLAALLVLIEAVRSSDPLRPALLSVLSAVGILLLVGVGVLALIRAVTRPNPSLGWPVIPVADARSPRSGVA